MCDMFGVNVAKSSLHLHFLKTLEFRTDVSVTSMPGVAKDIRACHFTPTILHGDPRSDRSNSLPQSFCSSCTFPRWVRANMTIGPQTSEGLCTSTLLRGRFLPLSPEPGRKGTPGREGLLDASAAWTPGAQIPARSPHVKVVTFLFYSVVVLSPFLVIDFTKESCSESPGSGRRGQED